MRGFQGVKIAKISCDSPEEGTLSIQFQEILINPPMLEDALTVFFPVSAANRLLNLQHNGHGRGVASPGPYPTGDDHWDALAG